MFLISKDSLIWSCRHLFPDLFTVEKYDVLVCGGLGLDNSSDQSLIDSPSDLVIESALVHGSFEPKSGTLKSNRSLVGDD